MECCSSFHLVPVGSTRDRPFHTGTTVVVVVVKPCHLFRPTSTISKLMVAYFCGWGGGTISFILP